MIRPLTLSLVLLALPAAAQSLDDMIVRDQLDRLERQNRELLDRQRDLEFQRQQDRYNRDIERLLEDGRQRRQVARDQDEFDRIVRDLRRKER